MADTKKYLDLEGLGTYSDLMKNLISTEDTKLEQKISSLSGAVGGLIKGTELYYKWDEDGNYIYDQSTGTATTSTIYYERSLTEPYTYTRMDPQPPEGYVFIEGENVYQRRVTDEPTTAEAIESNRVQAQDGSYVYESVEVVSDSDIDNLFEEIV